MAANDIVAGGATVLISAKAEMEDGLAEVNKKIAKALESMRPLGGAAGKQIGAALGGAIISAATADFSTITSSLASLAPMIGSLLGPIGTIGGMAIGSLVTQFGKMQASGVEAAQKIKVEMETMVKSISSALGVLTEISKARQEAGLEGGAGASWAKMREGINDPEVRRAAEMSFSGKDASGRQLSPMEMALNNTFLQRGDPRRFEGVSKKDLAFAIDDAKARMSGRFDAVEYGIGEKNLADARAAIEALAVAEKEANEKRLMDEYRANNIIAEIRDKAEQERIEALKKAIDEEKKLLAVKPAEILFTNYQTFVSSLQKMRADEVKRFGMNRETRQAFDRGDISEAEARKLAPDIFKPSVLSQMFGKQISGIGKFGKDFGAFLFGDGKVQKILENTLGSGSFNTQNMLALQAAGTRDNLQERQLDELKKIRENTSKPTDVLGA